MSFRRTELLSSTEKRVKNKGERNLPSPLRGSVNIDPPLFTSTSVNNC